MPMCMVHHRAGARIPLAKSRVPLRGNGQAPRLPPRGRAGTVIASLKPSLLVVPYGLPTADHDYWLACCQDFLVDTPEGPLGIVDRVISASSTGRPKSLVVSLGWFGRRFVQVRVEDVLEILPSQRRLVVRTPPGRVAAPERPGLLERLRRTLRQRMKGALPPARQKDPGAGARRAA